MEIDADTLASATAAVERLDALARRAGDGTGAPRDPELVDAFREAMDDDFGTAAALAAVFEGVRRAHRALDEGAPEAASLVATVVELAGVLGLELGGAPAATGEDDAEIDALLAERTAARAGRDFARADAIRDELTARGITIEDTPNGPIWRRT
jgi:cysteinyl-tRNA synthetase